MIPILPKQGIDDLFLYKRNAAEKMGKVLSFIGTERSKPLTKTASTDQSALINLFTQMLSALNLKAENAPEVLGNLLNKEASVKKSGKERRDDIKIVSKSVKDSHYQIDVSKDMVSKDGQKVIMVSCYARDAYLGRYLIKRNYFFTPDREKFADEAYDEIMLKVGAIKDRYYKEVIDIHGITTQLKTILDGVISEIKSDEDHVGQINRNPNA